MQKDIIYIDVEDDITAIIGKVKDAKAKVVALVPPKRIGVLQSTVNLRLLNRAATQDGKHLVVISTNASLVALAAAAKIPFAKNLQSKPAIAVVQHEEEPDDETDDIIDGASLPIGDLARTADTSPISLVKVKNNTAVDSAIEENAAEDAPFLAKPPAPGQSLNKAKAKKGIKVPNFNSFRKKLLIIITVAILLIGFLVWALFFAAKATVMITARTTDSSVNNRVTLANNIATDAAANTLKTTVQQAKKTISAEFEATGSRDAGERASGTMKLTRTNPNEVPLTVPAGTQFIAANRIFVSTESATLVSERAFINPNPGTAIVAVKAVSPGDEFNLSARAYDSGVTGVRAEGSEMSGGTHREVKVVSPEDIQTATEALKNQPTEAIKKQLKDQLGGDVRIIDETFKIEQAPVVSTPAVDQEVPAGTKPKLTSEVTYSLSGVDKNEVNTYLNALFKVQLKGLEDQRTYDNGADTVTFTSVVGDEKGFSSNIVATAQIGPKIEDSTIKSTTKGKRYGEIQSSIESIQGVENVDVDFWPFWVTAAPDDVDKITVEFKLRESK